MPGQFRGYFIASADATLVFGDEGMSGKPQGTKTKAVWSATDRVVDTLNHLMTGHPVQPRPTAHVPLPFEYAEVSQEALEFALKRGEVLAITSADWKEGPILILNIAALIAEVIRPEKMPSVPSLTFGANPIPAIRSLSRRVNLTGAVETDVRLIAADDGSDRYLFALATSALDLSCLEANLQRAAARKAAADRKKRNATRSSKGKAASGTRH